MEDSIKKEIEQLKREKDVVILAHYYVDGEVQALADYVGDSYFLAKKATEITEIKAHSDVCVTSSNALRVVQALPNRDIFFVPDENLGRYIASQIPEKNFILNDGFCHVHTSIYKEELLHAKALHPEALVLAHPECRENVLEISDFIGSTSEILSFAELSEAKELFCGTPSVLPEYEKNIIGKSITCFGDIRAEGGVDSSVAA